MPYTLLNPTSLDAIAPRLDNLTTGAIFSAFANANETVTSAHGHGWLA